MANQEWRDQNADVLYPFAKDATLEDISGVSRIRTSDFVDISVVWDGDAHISQLTRDGDSISGVVSSGSTVVGTFTSASPQGEAVEITGSDNVPRGVVVFGPDPDIFSELAPGVTSFTSAMTGLFPGAVLRHATGVSSIKVGDTVLRGRVRLEPGDGVRFEVDEVDGQDVITVNAIGAQSGETCVLGTPLETINSVPPASGTGALFIRVADLDSPADPDTGNRQVIRVFGTRNGIIISAPDIYRL